MPGIPEDIIEKIRIRADIVEIIGEFLPLKQRGNDFWGCCPFHHEKTPSFKVNQERQVFYCFGCKKSGNVFKFVQEMENTDFVGAIRWLADKYGIDIPENDNRNGWNREESAQAAARRKFREQGMALLADAADYFHRYLLQAPQAEIARIYLQERGRSPQAIEQFRIGFSPDGWETFGSWAIKSGYTRELLLATGLSIQRENARGENDSVYDRFRQRLMFPISDEMGKVIGFSGRTLEKNPQSAKYVNSPDSDFFHKGKVLYGFNFARQKLKDTGFALVCEGQMDVIACHQAGLVQAIAAQGTAFTPEHAQLLKRSTNTVRLAFDGDTAGLKATLRTIKLLQKEGIHVSVVSLPPGEDPDSIYRIGGSEALAQIISASEEAVDFAFRNSSHLNSLSSPEGKSAVVSDTLDVIASIKDPIARAAHCQDLAKKLHLPETILQDSLAAKLAQESAAEERERKYQERALQQLQTDRNHPPRQTERFPRQAIPPHTLLNGMEEEPIKEESIIEQPKSRIREFLTPMMSADNTGQVLETILDLILHHEFLATRLRQSNAAAGFPDMPVSQAINYILAYEEEGDWAGGIEALVGSDLVNNSGVGEALADSRCPALPANDGSPMAETRLRETMEKLERQLQDCLVQLTINQVKTRLNDIQKNIDSTEEPEKALLMLRDKIQLQHQLADLKKQLG